jgi:hypothetical protein
MDGLRLFRLNVLGKRVLLKPNLVEDLPGPVNTNANIIGAAARCFLRLGAPGRDRRGSGPSTRHRTRSAGREPETSSRGPADRVRRPQPRRTRESEAEGELQRPRRAVVAAHGSRFRFRRLNAQGEDASLGGRHPEPEEYVRHRAGNEVRLAEESAALARDSRKHSRYLRDSARSIS